MTPWLPIKIISCSWPRIKRSINCLSKYLLWFISSQLFNRIYLFLINHTTSASIFSYNALISLVTYRVWHINRYWPRNLLKVNHFYKYYLEIPPLFWIFVKPKMDILFSLSLEVTKLEILAGIPVKFRTKDFENSDYKNVHLY